MKIKRKILFSDLVKLLFLLIISWFAIVNLEVILSKLKFVEILDDLNVSLLEMRLSEKNYFLYGNREALSVLETEASRVKDQIVPVREDIIKATGEETVRDLENYLDDYGRTAADIEIRGVKDMQSEEALRARGRKLKEFTEYMTRIERARVNEMVSRAERILITALIAVFAMAIIISHAISLRILGPIKQIEKLARSISRGNYSKIDTMAPKDEFGPVIEAINSMSEELKNREDAIIQSKKLASMGILCAGVAHELNNPLNNIAMISQTYQDLYPKLAHEQRIEFMREIEAETDRIKEIVKNLLDFSRPKELLLKAEDINSIVEKTLKLLQNMINISDVELLLDLKTGLPPVRVDSNQIQQVLVNLVMNALQALPRGGMLSVSTGKSKDDAVQVNITDTGKGIPSEFLPHIFDPFFSTKEEGGTGLGLWISYGIIKNHGGDLRVKSELGKGSNFTMELPVFR